MATGIDVKNEVRSSFDRATQLLNSGDVLMAESICRETLHRYPEDCNLLCLLGLVLNRQQRPSEAETALRTVVEKFPEFAKAHEELGSAFAFRVVKESTR